MNNNTKGEHFVALKTGPDCRVCAQLWTSVLGLFFYAIYCLDTTISEMMMYCRIRVAFELHAVRIGLSFL